MYNKIEIQDALVPFFFNRAFVLLWFTAMVIYMTPFFPFLPSRGREERILPVTVPEGCVVVKHMLSSPNNMATTVVGVVLWYNFACGRKG
jgi:hypothetical protein